MYYYSLQQIIGNCHSLFLEGGVVSGKILKSFSVTHQAVVTLLEKTLAQFYSGQKYYGP